MKNHGMTIAALVLVALLGLLFWSNRHKPQESSQASTTPAEVAPKILVLNEADITKIELKKKKSEQIIVTKDSAGTWKITAPQSLAVDQTVVSGMLSTLASLNSERLVEEKGTNLNRYGLSDPALSVVITDKNNSTHKLMIGDDTPTGNAAYANVEGDTRVFTIASFTKTSVDKDLDELRDKKLFTFGFTDPMKIEIHNGSKSYSLTKGGDDWWSADGKKFERAGAHALVEQLRELQASDFAESGFATTVMDFTVTSNDGRRVEKVLISKGDKSPVARREGEATIYVLSSTAIDDLQKLLNDLKPEGSGK